MNSLLLLLAGSAICSVFVWGACAASAQPCPVPEVKKLRCPTCFGGQMAMDKDGEWKMCNRCNGLGYVENLHATSSE